jgi:hypothetical protein
MVGQRDAARRQHTPTACCTANCRELEEANLVDAHLEALYVDTVLAEFVG